MYRNFLVLVLLCFANVYAREQKTSCKIVENTVETSAKVSRNEAKKRVEAALYYNRFRYYSPETGTYLSQDPIGLAGNNPNFYAYVHNSNSWIDVFGLAECKFDSLVGSKNFKDHFIKHKKLIEDLTGKKYSWKTDQDAFLKDINQLINDDVFQHVGQGTLKKDQPIMEIFKSDNVTTVIKDLGNGVGEWTTSITRGQGMDLGIQFL
jgi:RHS repeat-associated protein